MKIATSALVLLALSIAPALARSAPTPAQLAHIEAVSRAIGCPVEIDGNGNRYRGMSYKSWIWTDKARETHVITVYASEDKWLERCMPDKAQ